MDSFEISPAWPPKLDHSAVLIVNIKLVDLCLEEKLQKTIIEGQGISAQETVGLLSDHGKVIEETIGKDGVSSEEKTVKNTRGLSQEAVEKLDDGNSALWATMCGYHKKKISARVSFILYSFLPRNAT